MLCEIALQLPTEIDNAQSNSNHINGAWHLKTDNVFCWQITSTDERLAHHHQAQQPKLEQMNSDGNAIALYNKDKIRPFDYLQNMLNSNTNLESAFIFFWCMNCHQIMLSQNIKNVIIWELHLNFFFFKSTKTNIEPVFNSDKSQ